MLSDAPHLVFVFVCGARSGVIPLFPFVVGWAAEVWLRVTGHARPRASADITQVL